MKQVTEYKIAAPEFGVWQVSNDPEILGSSILGGESFEKIDSTHFDTSLKAKVAPV